MECSNYKHKMSNTTKIGNVRIQRSLHHLKISWLHITVQEDGPSVCDRHSVRGERHSSRLGFVRIVQFLYMWPAHAEKGMSSPARGVSRRILPDWPAWTGKSSFWPRRSTEQMPGGCQAAPALCRLCHPFSHPTAQPASLTPGGHHLLSQNGFFKKTTYFFPGDKVSFSFRIHPAYHFQINGIVLHGFPLTWN